MKKYFWAIFFAVAFMAVSCSIEKKAKKSFRKGDYQVTIEKFGDVLKKNPSDPIANFYTGEALRKSNRIWQAEPYYAAAIGNGIRNDSVKLFYAYALKANKKYDEARNVLDDYIANARTENWISRAEDEKDNLNYLERILEKESYFRVRSLDALNTPAAEYAPVYQDGQLYFTSSGMDNKIYKATGTPFTNIFSVTTNGANVEKETLKALNENINNYNANEGTVAFTPDGRIMVFARGNSGKRKGGEDVNLFVSTLRNNDWSEPRMLRINEPGFWDSTPAFSRDGKTLYFASNRPGGYGGTDLYSARVDGRGNFSRVRNLGPDINTSGNEMFPHVGVDNSLFFASDGHPGYGGLDLFVATRRSGKIEVENLGQPMNSNADDFGLFLFRADRGFFSSNREGGAGDDDIYTFVNEDPNLKIVNYFLQGVTMTNENERRVILPNVRVQLLDNEAQLLEEATTGPDGRFNFRVYENERYNLFAEKVGGPDRYFNTRVEFSTVGRGVLKDTLKTLVTNVTYDTLLVLEKLEKDKIFVLENIYYDFNKWDIRPDAALELDKLVTILKDNPALKIEMGAHTDSVDTEEYNLWLSQKRAESAVDFLASRGIERNRLVAKGYGEGKPIAPNSMPDGSDNPEGRQKNRRTEFKILEVGTSRPTETDDDFFDEDRFFRDDF